jgi:hypothetical protein
MPSNVPGPTCDKCSSQWTAMADAAQFDSNADANSEAPERHYDLSTS